MKIIWGWVISSMLLVGIGSQEAFAATISDLTYNSDGTVVDFSLAGLTPAGNPNFFNDVTVTWNNGRRYDTLTAVSSAGGNMFFTSGLTNGVPDVYRVQDGSFKLNAKFDNAGNLLSGSLSIKGRLIGPDFGGKGRLVSADLDLSAFVLTDNLIGFNTVNINCRIKGVDCTKNESVYLSLGAGGFSTALRSFTSTGLAVTTVPLPAAVWLLGSGLVGLAGFSRHRRETLKV